MTAVLIVFMVVVALITKWCLCYDPHYSPECDPMMYLKLIDRQVETERKLRIKTEEAKLSLDILRLVKDGKPIVYEYPKLVVTADALEGLEDAYKDAGKNEPCIVWKDTDNERIEKFYRYVNAWLQHDKDTDQLYLDYVNANKQEKDG